MKQIDLDDLPARVARMLGQLESGEELLLVQNGGVVARLTVATAPAPSPDPLAGQPPDEAMAEVMEHFKTMIEDEF
jgi:antitoxin (DNA-binding transcriptional repressor) of toxin-antitoxin stability system